MAKAKAKKGSKKAAAKRTTAMTGDTRITLAKGKDPKAMRGLMAKMASKLAGSKAGVSRDDLAKAFPKDGRVKVMKNVQWGVRHGVFASKAA